MAGYWPKAAHSDNAVEAGIAAIMNDVPKVVFSKTLASADWPEARITRGDTAEEIAALKAEPGGEIVAHGGAAFARSLARLELVNEYRLYVMPFAIGSGTALFGELERPQALRLVSSTASPSGIVELVYQRTGG
jgi:dihydrofolate reductase